MTAPVRVSRSCAGVAAGGLTPAQPDAVRLLIARRMRHQAAVAALTDDSSADGTGLDRAMAALRMYGAREAIEAIDERVRHPSSVPLRRDAGTQPARRAG